MSANSLKSTRSTLVCSSVLSRPQKYYARNEGRCRGTFCEATGAITKATAESGGRVFDEGNHAAPLL